MQIMLPILYHQVEFANVQNLADFYKTSLPETPKIRALVDGIKLLFSLPQSNLQIYVAEGKRIYKIIVLSKDVQKMPFGYFVYIPGERRLDAYSAESEIPIAQWKNRKPVYSGVSMFLEKAGVLQVFDKLTNIL